MGGEVVSKYKNLCKEKRRGIDNITPIKCLHV